MMYDISYVMTHYLSSDKPARLPGSEAGPYLILSEAKDLLQHAPQSRSLP